MTPSDPGADASDPALDDGAIHDVLRNDRRRLVLERLREGSGEDSVGDLAEFVAEVESGESPPPKNVRQSVYVSLHQTHLPKLDSLHIVSYDSVAKEVSLGSRAAELDPYFGETTGASPIAAVTFATCIAGIALLLASWMGVPVIEQVDPRLLAGTALVAVAAASGAELNQWTRGRA